jgi:hypothetical protein
MTNPLDRFRSPRGAGADVSADRLSVLVALRGDCLEEEARARLELLGLVVDRVVQNKVIGSIPASRLTALRGDPAVAQVEVSARLRPHE